MLTLEVVAALRDFSHRTTHTMIDPAFPSGDMPRRLIPALPIGQIPQQVLGLFRAVGDYLAGMTDRFCDQVFESL